MFIDKDLKDVLMLACISRVFYISISCVASILIPPFDKSTELVQTNSCMKFLLSWDAVHFLEIMKNGYAKIHETAFFPFLPYVSRAVNKVLRIEPYTTGVLVSCIATILSSGVLYKITLKRYGSTIAKISVVLFIFNPASIVYTAMYSESLFMLAFVLGMHFLEENNAFHGTAMLSLCGLCRSNAVLFAPFVLFPLDRFSIMRTAFFLLPLATFQYYSLLIINKAKNTYRIFVPYSYVQKTYWEQGLFKFFTSNNIPNIILGTPFLAISTYILFEYWNGRLDANKSAARLHNNSVYARNTRLLAIILFAQTLIAVFLIHWNMYFRFISFNPLLYWILAEKYNTMQSKILRRLLFRFFFGFGLIYALLFGCFYPPA
ncbi:putative PIG-V mannosyl transferase [Ordospora pajunii]|uniref:putative PIG-V mannosyl transferase n=1 Tax=Ordospora pajunii TaxID=3039483 RepID=UPI00295261DB|nr:putative PIG-V mannosyl transferase [Ordospora pajunii]KAH9410848.1 putative PIG-V mannosyl transferase [Ordospora pajunii]